MARADSPIATILNVDDCDAGRYAITRTLQHAGYQVIEAANGAEAIGQAHAHCPDLIILDVNLPDIGGFEIAKRLKANPGTALIPIMYLSATAVTDEFVVEGLESGADAYLIEPASSEVLLSMVKALLRTARVQQDLAAANAKLSETNEELAAHAEELESMLEELRVTQEETDRHAQAARASETRYSGLFETMQEGIFVADVVCNAAGKPIDYRYLDVNTAFVSLMGLEREQIIGRTVREVLPGVEDFWIETYGQVALTGIPTRIKQFAAPLGRYYDTVAYSPRSGQVAVLFSDVTARKQAEQALRESEKKYRTLTENTPAVIQRFDEKLRVIYISPQVEEATGMPPEQFIGKTNEEIGMPPDLCEMWNDLFHRVQTSKQAQALAFDFPGPAGVKAYVLKVIPEFASDGSVESFLGISTDITERKQSEEALRKSEARLQLAQEAAQVGVFEWNIPTNHTVWTAELERLHGLRPGEFDCTFAMWEQLIHPEDRVAVLQLTQQSIHTGELTTGEWRIVWPDGSVHWLAGRWQVMRDPDGQPLRMIGVNYDITARKQAEKALRESEEKYRAMIETTQEGVLVTSPEGEILFLNQRMAEMTGFSPEEVVGRNTLEFIDEKERTQILSGRDQLSKGDSFSTELPVRHKNGSVIWTLCQASPLLSDTGQPLARIIHE